MTAGQALAAMHNAVARYRQATAEFAARGDAWGRRHADPVTAESRRREDPVRALIGAEAAWYRDEAAMYAAVAAALLAQEREVAL
jgi:hypothetical protein